MTPQSYFPAKLSPWFVQLERLDGLLVLGCLVVAAAICGLWLRRQLRKSGFLPPPESAGRLRGTAILIRLAALLLVAFAVMDPRVGQSRGEFGRSSEQIVLLLDRSRSMRAEDAQPSRFGLAVNAAQEVVDRSLGAAIAVVSFATDARIDLPLSRDSRELHYRLQALRPEQNAQAGTSLARGLRLAAECFAKPLVGRKRMLVLTDGETHEEVSLAGIDMPPDVEVLFLGIGDFNAGARIPLEPDERQAGQTQYFVYEGQTIWTKSRPEKLKNLAQRWNGSYAMMESPSQAVQIVFGQRRGIGDSRQWQRLMTATPIYAPLCCGALLLLAAEWLLLGGNRSAWSTGLLPTGRTTAACLTAAFLAFCAGGAALPQTGALTRQQAADIYNQGVEAYRRAAWHEAEARFREALTGAEPPISRRSRFNLANTHYEVARRGEISRQEATLRLTEAIDLYRRCISEQQRADDARANLQIAYSLLKRLESREPDRRPSEPQRDGSSTPPPPEERTAGSEVGRSDRPDGEIPHAASPPDSGSQDGAPPARPGATDDWTPAEAEEELRRIEDQAKRRTPEGGKKDGQGGTTIRGLPW